jgi:hypothetical protein
MKFLNGRSGAVSRETDAFVDRLNSIAGRSRAQAIAQPLFTESAPLPETVKRRFWAPDEIEADASDG